MGYAGYQRETTPNLDQLAADGIAYTRAYAGSTWTAPSHASLFTGMLPTQHGARRSFHRKSQGDVTKLSSELTTMAELLQEAGYSTAGFLGAALLSSEFGFAQGFDHYEDDWIRSSAPRPSAARINEQVLGWLAKEPQDPFFLFLNYFDPHAPYEPDPERNYPFGPIAADQPELTYTPEAVKRKEIAIPDEETLDVVMALYDQEIYATDYYLGQLFAALQERQLWDSTLVIVTADHGEAFGEPMFASRLWGHGNFPSHLQSHVPLVMKVPSGAVSGKVVEEPVSNIDILPTLIDLLDLATPSGVYGTSLLDHVDHRGRRSTSVVMAERYYHGRYSAALWHYNFELLEILEAKRREESWTDVNSLSSTRFRFEHGETPNRLESQKDVLATMRASRVRFRAERGNLRPAIDDGNRDTQVPVPQVDGELEERLKALGYID